jgi:hypothetical protein
VGVSLQGPGAVVTRSYCDSVSCDQPLPGEAQSYSVYEIPSHRKYVSAGGQSDVEAS